MVKAEPSGPRNLVTCSGQAQTHANVFYQLRFKNNVFISERDLALWKTWTFDDCFYNYPLGKAGLVDWTDLLTSTLLMLTLQ